MSLYLNLIRPLLFQLDSEVAHDFALGAGEQLSIFSKVFSTFNGAPDPRLMVKVGNLSWPSPIGLAAGFDKDCRIVPLLDSLGFGAIEIGSVTSEFQPGNPKPRIFRFPNDHALINRMGFPSGGVDAVEARLKQLPKLRAKLGINIGKAKSASLEDAAQDYLKTFERLKQFGDYFVVNVSSPNTVGLRQLQDCDKLEQILKAIQSHNTDQKPLYVKLSPDLTEPQIDEALECCLGCGLSGVIATNTTTTRDGLSTTTAETGGMSGVPLFPKSLARVAYISQKLAGRLPVIGVGGLRSVENVLQMMVAGAAAVQLYSALIFEGPGLVSKLNRELIQRMEQHRVSSLSELIDCKRRESPGKSAV